MTPVRLSYIWYQRLSVGLFAASLGYLIVYALGYFTSYTIPDTMKVDTIGAVGALVVTLGSIALYFLAKKVSSFLPALVVYGIFTLTTAYLVQSTGGVHSTFLVLWAFALLIAPVFGAYGWLPALVITGSYVASEYLSGSLMTEVIVLVALSSALPLVAGIVLWRDTSAAESTTTKDVKHLASQLSEVAAKSEIVINAIGDGVIAVDGTGAIQLINPAAQEILGWGKQDALILHYTSILKLADENNNVLDPSQDPIQQVLNTNQQTRGHKIIGITKSGKKISLSLVASPIGDVGSGAIAVFRDVTNERAEEREQAEFISTASHEMRTPVASIEGYLGLALNTNTATIDQRARDFILKAHEAAQHLGRLFQDLLDVSKSEDGRMTNTPRVVDIVPFTQTIVQGLTQKAGEKGLALKFVPSEGMATERGIKKIMPVYYINLDNDHVREVLDNLIENAIKYTPNGEVSVDITGQDDKVVISIKDTGLGIPPEDIPHLFQKFYRVNNADRQSIGGTGLGLYLCRRLIEAMQGRLWVESNFGSGSTFFVELPRIETQEAERLKEEQSRQPLKVTFPAAPGPVAAPTTPIAVTFAGTPSAPTPATVAAPPPADGDVTQPIPAAASLPQQSVPPTPAVQPATTVPRGEALTREQILARARQLEAMAQQQRGSVTPPQR
jgi:PAS domain S-box-containing protein